MVDFKKLLDPAFRAEAAEKRAKESAARSALDAMIRDAMRLCEFKFETLSPQEQDLVQSLKRGSVLNIGPPTANQQKWLFDIALRLSPNQSLLVLDRIGRVLVEKPGGYGFERMSTDLRGAVAFDQAGAEDAMGRIQGLLPADGPFRIQSVRDFKMAVIDSFVATAQSAVSDSERQNAPRM